MCPVPIRSISLASIFGPRKPTATPSPSVVANIATLEADADANPQDIHKQTALYEALLATKVKPAYDTIIARWERTCTFVSLHNECDDSRMLIKQTGSIKSSHKVRGRVPTLSDGLDEEWL